MKSLRGPSNRTWRILRLGFSVAATLVLLLRAQKSSAVPRALHVTTRGELYEFDVRTGEYALALTFDSSVRCHELTRGGDALFCSVPVDFGGNEIRTVVRRLEPSTASVAWQVTIPDLAFPNGIAFMESLLYVVANPDQGRDFFLLTLDPATGEELARVQLPGEFTLVLALAARGPELWVMARTNADGTAARRLDPSTGAVLEVIVVPSEISYPDDADFDPDGRLYQSRKMWNPIGTAWCTDYWIVPFLGGFPEHQFSHCWDLFQPGDAPPTLAFFTLADRNSGPVVEIPTLSAATACALAALLAAAGVLALRRAGMRNLPGA